MRLFHQAQNNPLTTFMSNIFPFAISQSVSRVASNPSALSLADPFRTAGAAVLSVSAVDLHAPTEYLQSWNLTVGRELRQLGALEIAYVVRLSLGDVLHRNRPHAKGAAPSVDGEFDAPGNTYAKSIDTSSAFSGTGNGSARQIQDPRNLAAERGRSNSDIGHSFTMNFSYQVPWRRNEFGWLMRGWQLAGSGHAATGQPFTPISSGFNLNLGQAIRPDRLRKGTAPNPTPERWFDLSAFSVVPSGSYRFGTSGRNILDGPGFLGMNLSLSKNMQIRERGRLQFRWEAFNVFNHPKFSTVTGGTITSASSGRSMQLGLRYSF
jgi:hypothetical protein